MTAVPWQPTRDEVSGALISATGDDLDYGASLRDLLTDLGEAYDLVFSAEVDLVKTASEGLYATALAAWRGAAQSSHEQADRAARYAERVQALSQGDTPTPFVSNGRILASSAPIAFDFPDEPSSQARFVVTSYSAAIFGTVDLATIDYSLFANPLTSTLSVTLGVIGGGTTTFTVAFEGVTTPAGIVAAIQNAGGTFVAPYLQGTKLVLADAPGLTVKSTIAAFNTGAEILGVASDAVLATPTSLYVTSKLLGVRGNGMTMTIGNASDGLNAHVKLTAAWGEYVEEFDNVDTLISPNVAGSRLLDSVISIGVGHIAKTTGSFVGGFGLSYSEEVARLEAARLYEAAIAAGQDSVVSAHLLRYTAAYAAAPSTPRWLAFVPIPVVGVSTNVPLTNDGHIDVFMLEQALTDTIAKATEFLIEFDSGV